MMLLSWNIAAADEFSAVINKVDGTSINLNKYSRGEKGDELTLTAIDDCNVLHGKYDNQAKDTKYTPVGDGLKSDHFRDKVRARIITNSDNKVTEIRIPESIRDDGILGVINKVDGDTLTVFKIDRIRTIKTSNGRTLTETKGREMTYTLLPYVMVVKVNIDKDTRDIKIKSVDKGLRDPIFEGKVTCRLILDGEGKVYEIRINTKEKTNDKPAQE